MQKIGIITKDLFLVGDNNQEPIQHFIAKKCDIAKWNDDFNGWTMKDELHIPSEFIKEEQLKETNIQKTGTITEDIFIIHNNYQDFEVVNKEELETTYDNIAKKGDLVTWDNDDVGWFTNDDVLVPEDFVKVKKNQPIDIIGRLNEDVSYSYINNILDNIVNNLELSKFVYQVAECGNKVIWDRLKMEWILVNDINKTIPKKFVEYPVTEYIISKTGEKAIFNINKNQWETRNGVVISESTVQIKNSTNPFLQK